MSVSSFCPEGRRKHHGAELNSAPTYSLPSGPTQFPVDSLHHHMQGPASSGLPPQGERRWEGTETLSLASLCMFEVISHFLTSPQVLSCHRRLGTPLPPRDASRLAVFMSAASSFPTTLELHKSVLSSLADVYLHGGAAVHMDIVTAMCVPSGGAGQEAESNHRGGAESGESVAQGIWQDVWRRHGVLPLDTVPSTLERVRNLEALGTVGGRWGGVMPRSPR